MLAGQTLFSLLNLVRSDRASYPSVKVAFDEVVSPRLSPAWRPTDSHSAQPSQPRARTAHRYPSLPQSPSTSPIHLHLSSPSAKLLFNGPTQRLCRIEVHGEHPGRFVNYRGQSLAAPAQGSDDPQEAVKTIRRVMGPTYSSSRGASGSGAGQEEEVLAYPGVAFEVGVREGGGEQAGQGGHGRAQQDKSADEFTINRSFRVVADYSDPAASSDGGLERPSLAASRSA